MKNSYAFSRIVICVLAGVISLITFHNEHITLMLGATLLITVVALLMSFLATPVSKQMIGIGDRIMNKYLRAFYYFENIEQSAEIGATFMCSPNITVSDIPDQK